MALKKRGPSRRSLLAALDAALPLHHRPPRKIMLRQLGKDPPEIHLSISRRPEPPRSTHPSLITPINTLTAARTKLRILHMKHLDPFVIQVDEFQIIQLLQHEMARIIRYLDLPIFAHAPPKQF